MARQSSRPQARILSLLIDCASSRILCAALLLIQVASTAEALDSRARVFLLFSNSSNGLLKSCYCPNAPWGGLAKRKWLVGQLRSEIGPESVLLVDSGDLFPVEYDASRILTVMRLYEQMVYDAVAIGDQELLGGLDKWRDSNDNLLSGRLSKQTFPWVSAGYSITNAAGAREQLATPWVFKNKSGVRVGILSVVGSRPFQLAPTGLPAGVVRTDPVAIARQFVEDFSTELDLVVVLSHQGVEDDRELAASVNGIDIIVGGHSQTLINPPEVVNGTIITQAGKNGENLGVMLLTPRTEAPYQAHIGTNAFSVTTAAGSRWSATTQLVPLDSTVDEDLEAAQLIADYFAAEDEALSVKLRNPAEPAEGRPRLIVENPVQSITLRPAESREVVVRVRNVGAAALEITKARSRIRWLDVLTTPTEIPAGKYADLKLRVTARGIDRYFRSPYTITSTDESRVVVSGTINGSVEGALPGIVDVGELVSNLVHCSSARITRHESLLPTAASKTEHTTKAVSPTSNVATDRDILVEVFYTPGCADCATIKEDIIPAMHTSFPGLLDVRWLNVLDRTHYLALASLQDRLEVPRNETVSIFIDRKVGVAGARDLKTRLHTAITEIIAQQKAQHDSTPDDSGEIPETETTGPNGQTIITKRFEAFTVPAVFTAGLLDGLNPCAFATIIFFVTLLSVAGRRGADLLITGAGFCVAVFLTYLCIGFGLFTLLRELRAFEWMATAIRWLTVLALALLAVFSFRDAWRYKRSGKGADVTLQLPDGLKRRIHAVMRNRLKTRSLLLGSVATGFVVTLLESVCTGQLYVPTLVFMTKTAEQSGSAVLLLVLYNAAFVVPLVVVFAAAHRGMTNERLVAWSRRNVVPSKVSLGVFFSLLAGVMWLSG